MAAPSPSRPGRTLLILGLIVAALFGAVAWTARGDDGRWTPKLGLDLEGGTRIVLEPQAGPGVQITERAINEAVEIIRRRVDAFGVSEAEVSAQGTGDQRNIEVTVPGKPSTEILDAVRQTAQLRFRLVLDAQSSVAGSTSATTEPPLGELAEPAPAPGDSAAPGASGPAGSPPAASPGASASLAPGPSGTPAQRRVAPQALTALPAAAPSGAPAVAPAPAGNAPADGAPPAPGAPAAPLPPNPADPGAQGGDAAVLPGVPPEVQQRYATLNCSDPATQLGALDDPSQPLAACGQEDRLRYLLDKAALIGEDVSSAEVTPATNPQGNVIPGQWEVALEFTSDGTRKWGDFTTANVQRQVAVVLDGKVVSAPSINEPITGGTTSISGNFSQEEAGNLANVLQYGALPLTFVAENEEQISPALGSEQLQAGLIAGALGLILVIVYCLLYYRGLGVVNVISLFVSALMTYLCVVWMSNAIGARLSLAGVAGLIIGIGIAADSFIVYFERLRDEMREGKTMRVAVEIGWTRARRTILAADFVSFLAAIVLYLLTVGSVQGFALMLGLTTIIDIIVVFMFTKPVVTLLARTKFFSSGHWLSGVAASRLGSRRGDPLGRGRAAVARSSNVREA